MAVTITDNVNYIIINDGVSNSIVNKPYAVSVPSPSINIFLKSELEQQFIIKFEDVSSPVTANIQALALVLAQYNNTVS